jgi:hypothetical protein
MLLVIMFKHLLIALLALSLAGAALAQDACAKCKEAKMAACAKNSKPMTAEAKFLADAKRMQMKAEGKQECCESTPEKPIAQGDPGCCKAPGAMPKYMVKIGNKVVFYTCEDTAKKARVAAMAKGLKVGKLQKIAAKPAKKVAAKAK